jgi:predicted flap endonuclease-1-like 5' DNA nuclease
MLQRTIAAPPAARRQAIMQTLFGEAPDPRFPFMPMAFPTQANPWFAKSASAGYDAVLFWIDQWARFASFNPLAAYARLMPEAVASKDPAEAVAAALAPEPVMVESPATAPEPAMDIPVELAPAPEPVAAPAIPDELTRIVGIGPRLAAALAKEGVTTFAQLAAWTADDLATFDKALDLKGRAVRDAWVAQAKRFAESAAS